MPVRAETTMPCRPASRTGPWQRRATGISAVLVTATALAACGGSGGGSGTGFDAQLTTEVPAASADVDSVTWNLPTGEPAILDPAQSALENISTVVGNMCESLMRFGADYQLEPALAESMEQPDDLTYVFTLRDATFWDGNPVTAQDVVYSVDRVLDPATGSSWGAFGTNLASITATDDKTVTVVTTAPDPLISNYFATPAFSVVEESFVEQSGASFGTAGVGPMCTGPYRFDSWTQGQSIDVSRNADWWDTDTTPRVQAATFTFVTDPAAQTASLRSGETDGEWAAPASAFDQLDSSGNLLFSSSLTNLWIAPIDLTGPLGDPEVREALAASIDYQGITESVYRGVGEPIRTLTPPRSWGYAEDVFQQGWDDLPDPAQDLDRVREIVADDPAAAQEIVLGYSASIDEETRTATAIADAATQAGMDVTLRPLTADEFNALFSSAEAREGIDAFLTTGYLDFPEPLQYVQYFQSGSFYNFGGYANPEYDQLVGQALLTEDDDQRADLTVQAQAVLAGEHGVIPILSPYTSVYYSEDLAGLAPNQNYLYTPWLTQLGGA